MVLHLGGGGQWSFTWGANRLGGGGGIVHIPLGPLLVIRSVVRPSVNLES